MVIRNAGESADMKLITLKKQIGKRTKYFEDKQLINKKK